MRSTAPTRRARSADSCRTAASACTTQTLWTSIAASASARAWWLRGDRQSGIRVSGISNSFYGVNHYPMAFPASGRCLLWVKSEHRNGSAECPLYPRKRTLLSAKGMSALCQKRTMQKLSEFHCHKSFEQDQRKEVRSSINIDQRTMRGG